MRQSADVNITIDVSAQNRQRPTDIAIIYNGLANGYMRCMSYMRNIGQQSAETAWHLLVLMRQAVIKHLTTIFNYVGGCTDGQLLLMAI